MLTFPFYFSVEEYIYAIREKLYEELEQYILEADREAYSQKLSQTEDWLYEDGEDCEKNVYEEKSKELKMVGEAAKKRKSEFEGRKAAIDALGHSIQMATKVVEAAKAGDEKYNHISEDEILKVIKTIDEKAQWLNNSVVALEKCPKTTNPTVLNCQFYTEKDAFESICRPILNKPKPKVEPPKEDEKKAEEPKKASKEEEKMEETVNGGSEQQQQQQQQNMDLDW